MIKKSAIFLLVFGVCFGGLVHFAKDSIIEKKLIELTAIETKYKLKTRDQNRVRHRLKQLKARVKMERADSQLWLEFARASFLSGSIHKNTHQINQAQRVVQTLLSDPVSHPQASLLKAKIDLYKGNLESAFKQLNWLIGHQPELHFESMQVRAEAFLYRGELDLALQDIKHVIRSRPSLHSYALAGELYALKNNLSQAVSSYEEAFYLEKAKDLEYSILYRQRLAKTYLKFGFVDKAQRIISHLDLIDKYNPATLAIKAEIAIKSQSYSLARQLLKASFEKSNNPEVHLRLAQVEGLLINPKGKEALLSELEISLKKNINKGFKADKTWLVKALIEANEHEKFEEAKKIISSIKNRSLTDWTNQLTINFLLEEQEIFENYKEFTKKFNPQAQDLFNMSHMYSRNNNFVKSLYFYMQALFKNHSSMRI